VDGGDFTQTLARRKNVWRIVNSAIPGNLPKGEPGRRDKVADVRDETLSGWRRALVMGTACVALLITVFFLAVHTEPGQRFEDAVLRSAGTIAGSAEQTAAVHALNFITVRSGVAAAIVLFLIGLVRRRVLLAALILGMIAASVVTTEFIQRYASRPVLLPSGYRRDDQSFPSGHTTIAMAVLCGLVLVVPYRWRGLAVLLGWLGTAGVGVATVTASWHRPSDTVGADLIATGYACAVVAVLALCDRVRPAALPTTPGRTLRALLTGACATVAVLAFTIAAAVVTETLHASGSTGHGHAMLLAGCLLALSGSTFVAVALLALLRHLDLGASPQVQLDEGSPDVESRPADVHRLAGPQRGLPGGRGGPLGAGADPFES
jgi:membrane-associated phospholipid phosphatase